VGNNALNPKNLPHYVKAIQDLAPAANANVRRQLVTLSAELEEAIKHGAVLPSFSAEIADIYAHVASHPALKVRSALRHADFIDLWSDMLTKSGPGRTMTQIYDVEDQVFRYAAFLKKRSEGLSPVAASVEVNKYFPNYAVMSRFGNWSRGQARFGGMPAGTGPFATGPFMSFPLEALRIYSLAAKEHPYRLFAAQMSPFSMIVNNVGNNDMTMEDYHTFLRGLPKHLQGHVMIPFGEGTGPEDMNYVDITNAWPLAGLVGHPQGLMMQHPLKPLLEFGLNLDIETGRPMYDPARGEGMATGMVKAIAGMAPVPNMVKSGIRRGYRSINEVSPRESAPEPESFPRAIGSALVGGLEPKSGEELAQQGQIQRMGQMAETRRGIRSINRSKTKTEAEKEIRTQKALDYFKTLTEP